MATEKNGTYKVFNGTDYDIIYLKTILSQIFGPDGRSLSAMLNEDFAPSGFGLGEAGKSISNTDLNNYTLAGFYKGGNLSNAPNAGWFAIFVNSNSATNAVQMAVSLGVGNTGGVVYVRFCTSGIWSSWTILSVNSSGSASNFDTALTHGNYKVESGSTLTGAPYTGAIYGNLRVIVDNGTTHNNDGRIWQYFDNTVTSTLYTRCKVGSGSWGSWRKVIKSGDDAELNSVTANSGYSKLGKISAYSWNGSITHNTTVTITHNLGYKPIVNISGTRGNIMMTIQHIDNNSFYVTCYLPSGGSFTGDVLCW